MRNIALQLKSIFVAAVKIGVCDGIDLHTEKMIMLTNILAFLYAFFIFTFFTAFALSGLTCLEKFRCCGLPLALFGLKLTGGIGIFLLALV